MTWSYYTYFGGYDNNVIGRRFSKTGAALGGEFQINASTALNDDEVGARVASNASGDFVVTWTKGDPTGPLSADLDVGARRFDSSGSPVSGDVVVNQYTTGRQTASSVALDSTGAFVVVWNSYPNLGSGVHGQDGSGSGIFGRRFDSSGNPLGDEFRINEYTMGDQMEPRIAMRPDGNFLVVWNDDHNSAIMTRRYDAGGTPLGDEVQVNATGTLGVDSPDVALDDDGKAIVVWNVIPGVDAINGQRLDASGNKLGPEFNVHTGTTGLRRSPTIAIGPDGDFSVAWMSNDQDGDGQAVVAQRFDSTGRRVGGEFLVNTFTTGFQGSPAIAAQPNGQFVAAWNSPDQDGIAARIWGFPRANLTQVDVPHDGALSAPHGSSNLNGVLEAGEQAAVEPEYGNPSSDPLDLTGTASNLQGPVGPVYSLVDGTADYGTIDPGETSNCFDATGDCFVVGVSGARPAPHWDATFDETLSYAGFTRKATIHIGESFADVPIDHPFYALIENLVHNGVTAGCAGGGYCPGDGVTRAQMAVFLLKVRWGAEFLPAPATGTVFSDVPAEDSFAPWIEELAREGVTGGCGGTNYCPGNTVTRQQMAVFLLKALEGSAYDPPDCAGVFDDVTCTPGTGFSDWIEELANRGITGGCSVTPPLYCPTNPNNRGQMAVFLVKTFGLVLYGG